MKATDRFSLCWAVMLASVLRGEAFFSIAPRGGLLKFKSAAAAVTTPGQVGILCGKKDDKEVSVFDAGDVAVSWEEYKKTPKPDEFKLDKLDEMQCWKTDECPVEDNAQFTKAWQVRSAERNPTTETHFDSEGEWEEETKWSKKWHEDVGEDDLHEDSVSPVSKDGFGI